MTLQSPFCSYKVIQPQAWHWRRWSWAKILTTTNLFLKTIQSELPCIRNCNISLLVPVIVHLPLPHSTYVKVTDVTTFIFLFIHNVLLMVVFTPLVSDRADTLRNLDELNWITQITHLVKAEVELEPGLEEDTQPRTFCSIRTVSQTGICLAPLFQASLHKHNIFPAYTNAEHSTLELPLIDKERQNIIGNMGMLHSFWEPLTLSPAQELGIFYRHGFKFLLHFKETSFFFQ